MAVFTWGGRAVGRSGSGAGEETVGIDATTLEANAAMRSIERRDTGESYEAFVRRLAEASGIETPTRVELARFDRSRKNKKTSNKEWKSPQDPDAKIAKMKDGRTRLAHKAEHGVDLETGAIVSLTVQDASDGDPATLPKTLTMAAEQVETVQPDGAGVEEVIADKGYHSDETLVALDEVGVRSYRIGAGAGSAPLAGQEDGRDAAGEACCAASVVWEPPSSTTGGVASWWSGLARTSMKPVVYGGCGCAAMTMFASGCSSRRPAATSGCCCAA